MRPQKSKPELAIDDRMAAEERGAACVALYRAEAAGMVLDLLDASAFRDEASRAVWEGMQASWADRGSVSELDLIARGLSADELGPIRAQRQAVEYADPLELVRNVQGMHALDDVARLCRSEAERAAEQSISPTALRSWVADLARAMDACVEGVTVREEFPTARAAFEDWIDAQRDTGRSWRASWGLRELDERLGGIQPGTLHVPIGLPAHGKSALACTAAYATAGDGKRVLFVSREMRNPEVGVRFAAIANDIQRRGLEYAIKDGEDMSGFVAQVSDRIVPDDRSRTMADVRAKVRMAASQGDPFHLVVLDYIQLFQGPGDNRVDELSRLIYGAKDMAMDLDVAVIALAQVNRQNTGESMPTMRQIKGASAIEDAADSVVAIFKSAETTGGDGDRAWYDYDMRIEKARNGQSGGLDTHRLMAGTFTVAAKRRENDTDESFNARENGSHGEAIVFDADELERIARAQ